VRLLGPSPKQSYREKEENEKDGRKRGGHFQEERAVVVVQAVEA
jgi:hypothetical protein